MKKKINYVQRVQDLLEKELKMKGTDYEGLLETYGLLVLTVGVYCKEDDIHDAWAVWQNKTMPEHWSIVPFKELTKEVQVLDDPYKRAVIKVAKTINNIR